MVPGTDRVGRLHALRGRLDSWDIPCWPFAVGLLALSWLIVSPWGDYPLNDDWQYARIAKRLAETGSINVDLPIAPIIVGQCLLVAPFARIFGFSHVLLRILTGILAAVGLWAIDAILRRMRVNASARLAALCVTALNPLYLYFSMSFMTEIYGLVPGMLAVALWYWERARMNRRECDQGPPPPIARTWVSVFVALLCGSLWWIRQYAVLLYPALLGASLMPVLLARDFGRLRRSFVSLSAGLASFAAVIVVYFPWARATGNLRDAFTGPLSGITNINGNAWAIQSGVLLAYLTLYFLPLLVLVRAPAPRWKGLLLGALLVAVVLFARSLLQDSATTDFSMSAHLHRTFPFIGNITYNAGIGPITLADVFTFNLPDRPRWPAGAWKLIEAVVVVGTVLWGPALWRLGRILRAARRTITFEFLWFGLLFAAVSTIAFVQTYQLEVIDRYHFPVVLAASWLLAVVLGWGDPEARLTAPLPNRRAAVTPAVARQRASRKRTSRKAALSSGNRGSRSAAQSGAAVTFLRGGAADLVPWPARPRLVMAAILVIAIGGFTVGGLHDYFRWNDARWELARYGLSLGASPANIQGGYEVNGWLSHDLMRKKAELKCKGRCGCAGFFDCIDDSYMITMNELRGYKLVRAIEPRYWLARGPRVMLLERQYLR